MNNTKIINGIEHVWDIFENDWVTLDYWRWANGLPEIDNTSATEA